MAKTIGRRMMERDVTFTTVTLCKIKVENGDITKVPLPNEVIIGNATMEQAQRIVNQRYVEPVTVLGVQANTQTYVLPVEEFIKVATIKPKS